jgi:hypothetical protein
LVGELLLELLVRGSNPSGVGLLLESVVRGWSPIGWTVASRTLGQGFKPLIGGWGPTCPIRVHLGVVTGKHTAKEVCISIVL